MYCDTENMKQCMDDEFINYVYETILPLIVKDSSLSLNSARVMRFISEYMIRKHPPKRHKTMDALLKVTNIYVPTRDAHNNRLVPEAVDHQLIDHVEAALIPYQHQQTKPIVVLFSNDSGYFSFMQSTARHCVSCIWVLFQSHHLESGASRFSKKLIRTIKATKHISYMIIGYGGYDRFKLNEHSISKNVSKLNSTMQRALPNTLRMQHHPIPPRSHHNSNKWSLKASKAAHIKQQDRVKKSSKKAKCDICQEGEVFMENHEMNIKMCNKCFIHNQNAFQPSC